MDLSTTYLGLKLKNPLVVAASPLSETMDKLRRLEDAGASAVVHYSLFEEQILHDQHEMHHYLHQGTESFPEALSYFPELSEAVNGPEEYLKHISEAKKAVGIPVIGSLNGASVGGWVKYAKMIEEAGADALELNIYFLATRINEDSMAIENTYLNIFKSVKNKLNIPVSVKMHPYFTSVAHMARRMDEAGVDGLVLFNRFYQPDFDLERLEVMPNLLLSTPPEMRLPMRWIAILYGQVQASLAATTGVHYAEDVVKMIMAGADVTMLCSVLLRNGIEYIGTLLRDLELWMEQHEYESVAQMKGSMSHKSCENPQAFERANYMKVLHSFQSQTGKGR